MAELQTEFTKLITKAQQHQPAAAAAPSPIPPPGNVAASPLLQQKVYTATGLHGGPTSAMPSAKWKWALCIALVAAVVVVVAVCVLRVQNSNDSENDLERPLRVSNLETTYSGLLDRSRELNKPPPSKRVHFADDPPPQQVQGAPQQVQGAPLLPTQGPPAAASTDPNFTPLSALQSASK